ncbi:conserved hypothetical protein [Talaromyces stipitatus ATCC 10500]|uniref:HTH CENPB-type domain-containing protein n=1 Tax=Talaromyces stipitatus (strain ATCC 10500 / CBS 375.48 / QM 6759 / NRRL 1006) TaxID=441959 RepID=B8MFT7_TALSN|nr:uncharacterized protein TSTA_009260 [Talaromyces stipitatus ATCC 10500]EED15804.1 conserved hypothetical protein [Talaromyces stipitatus ATCC 10500]
MVNEADILKAISDLESQKTPQYAKTARKYNLEHSTLRRRYKGQTVSNQKATSIHRKLLTDAQEEVLLHHISKLSSRGLPPTPQILRNLVVELVQHDVRECWIHRFCHLTFEQSEAITRLHGHPLFIQQRYEGYCTRTGLLMNIKKEAYTHLLLSPELATNEQLRYIFEEPEINLLTRRIFSTIGVALSVRNIHRLIGYKLY